MKKMECGGWWMANNRFFGESVIFALEVEHHRSDIS
jgi:hypothetical protein